MFACPDLGPDRNTGSGWPFYHEPTHRKCEWRDPRSLKQAAKGSSYCDFLGAGEKLMTKEPSLLGLSSINQLVRDFIRQLQGVEGGKAPRPKTPAVAILDILAASCPPQKG